MESNRPIPRMKYLTGFFILTVLSLIFAGCSEIYNPYYPQMTQPARFQAINNRPRPVVPNNTVTETHGCVTGVKTHLNVRTGPSIKGSCVGKLVEGDQVVIKGENAGWYLVDTKASNSIAPVQGWVYGKYIATYNVEVPQYQNQTTTSSYGRAPDVGRHQRLREAQQKTVGESSLIGAVAGYGIAKIAGASDSEAATWAVVGGSVGLLAGAYAAQQREKYATEEEYLESCIQEAVQFKQQASQANRSLRESIQLTKLHISELKSAKMDSLKRRQSAKASVLVLEKTKKDLESIIQNSEGQIQANREALASATKSSEQVKKLKQEIVQCEQEVAILRQQRGELIGLIDEEISLSL